MKNKIKTPAGALRARGAALKALRSAVEALRRLDAFQGGRSAASTLIGLATAQLDGSVSTAVGLSDGWDTDDLLDAQSTAISGARRAMALVSMVETETHEAHEARASEDRAHRLAAALRDDPHGSRFDALDARQETASGLRLRGAS